MVDNIIIRRPREEDIFFLSKIDSDSYEPPCWSEDDFLVKIKNSENLSFVATIQDLVTGYVVYKPYQNALVILRMAVEKNLRRNGIGSALLQKLISRLNKKSQDRILLVVRESLLSTQLFLKSQQFKCTNIRPDFYANSEENGYLFRYLITEKK